MSSPSDLFEHVYGYPSQVLACAPGRVTVLGEHTDYNEGFVLPFAIARHAAVAMAYSLDGRFAFYSTRDGVATNAEPIFYRDGDLPPPGFARYCYGCIQALREQGEAVPPVAVLVDSDVPIGVGLSSSAALEVATLRALRELLVLDFDDIELARLAQRAEEHYVGVRCGLTDQMASSLADDSYMLFLDTRTLERRLVPFPVGTAMIVLDSGIGRGAAARGYATRRAECEAAARELRVLSLRDVFDPALALGLPEPLARRARHVITENGRVLRAAAGVDARTFGALMSESHASLRDDFEVSLPALDALVRSLERQPGTYGARLAGAGFGGACIALVAADAAAEVARGALADYAELGFRGALLAASRSGPGR